MSWPGMPFINYTNSSTPIPSNYQGGMIDGQWTILVSFVIFSMQTGFGLMESGFVHPKNGVNIMVKNVVDVIMGGFMFWFVGFGMAYGRGGRFTNPFIGVGDYLLDPPTADPLMGQILCAFVFEVAFANTATTLVSGAMAERIHLRAYCLFAMLNTVIYSVSAGWVWGEHGFLHNLGVVDIAGSGPVHIIGGTAAFTAAAYLGPRIGRFDKSRDPLPLGNSINACVGLFILWWSWLSFNAGSVYGITNGKWAYAAKCIMLTLLSSIGGGMYYIVYAMIRHKSKVDVMELLNSVLAGLVAISAGCCLYHPYEALLVGAVAAALTLLAMPIICRMGVDDPLSASACHTMSGIWGVLAIGLFAQNVPIGITKGRAGLFQGGGWELLGIQSISCVCLSIWGCCATFVVLFLINLITPIRMSPEEELLGADHCEHNIALLHDHQPENIIDQKNSIKSNIFPLYERQTENYGANGNFSTINQNSITNHRLPNRGELNLGYIERL